MRLAAAKLARSDREGEMSQQEQQKLDKLIKDLQTLIWIIEADL